MNRPLIIVIVALLLAGVAGPLAGQGLPPYAPINPMADSRTPVGFEPYHLARASGWRIGLALDYASAVEYFQAERASYVLDAELLRLRLRVTRDLSPKVFVMADAAAQGSYAGFLDGFLNWYHNLLGIRLEARELRPNNSFLYQLVLPDGSVHTRRSSDLYLGDMHLAAGFRAGRHVQAIATVALPTSTGPVGYGRGTIGLGVETTVCAPVARPLVYEGSFGLGYTPAQGDLSDIQRTTFASASSGLRWRFWGRQSLYANLFYHSPYYHDTTIPALDRPELSLDFGWILATKRGAEWRVGLTEDPEPSGPAIDLVFRLGVSR